jgi:hypothetical protein
MIIMVNRILVKSSGGEKMLVDPHVCERCFECKPLYSIDNGLAFLCMRCLTND